MAEAAPRIVMEGPSGAEAVPRIVMEGPSGTEAVPRVVIKGPSRKIWIVTAKTHILCVARENLNVDAKMEPGPGRKPGVACNKHQGRELKTSTISFQIPSFTTCIKQRRQIE